MAPTDPVDPADRDRAIAAARGTVPFDLLLTGGTVVDVSTGELRPADVGVVGPLIASVHPTGTRTDAAEVIDVSGRFVAPGFMDLHVHFESSMLSPGPYAAAVLPHGTTTIFADPHELGNVAGLDGVRYAIEASRGLPLRIIVQAPSCVPPVPGLERSGADILGPDVAEMLSWPEVAGVAEVMDMLGVLDRSDRMVGIVGAGLDSGKLISGHAATLSGPELQAYLCAGITSDHENFMANEVLEKVRSGMTVELRYALPHLLPEVVAELTEMPVFPTNLVTSSDDILASELVTLGNIDLGLRRIIAAGLDPVKAITAATVNGAYRLQRTDLGVVGAGRIADLVVLGEDLAAVEVEMTFASGQLVARHGRMVVDVVEGPSTPPYSSVKLDPVTAEDLTLRLDGFGTGTARIRTIDQPFMTQWGELEVDVVDDVVQLPPGVLRQASIHRHGRFPATPALAVLTGWGEWTGAIATTVSHDTHNLQVFGVDPADMALAANTVIASDGGVAVVRDGEVLASIGLPIAGLLSDRPVEEVVAAQDALEVAARSVGEFMPIVPQAIFQTFVTSLACLPGPHLTDVGLTDGTTGEVVPSILLGAVGG